MSQSKGEYIVGIGFNPSGDDRVARIKRAAADLIDLIDREIAMESCSTTAQCQRQAEINRLRQLAINAVEEGAMWAVKAATKREPE